MMFMSGSEDESVQANSLLTEKRQKKEERKTICLPLSLFASAEGIKGPASRVVRSHQTAMSGRIVRRRVRTALCGDSNLEEREFGPLSRTGAGRSWPSCRALLRTWRIMAFFSKNKAGISQLPSLMSPLLLIFMGETSGEKYANKILPFIHSLPCFVSSYFP